MKMTFRWYGPGQDPVPLAYIRQIPGVRGVVSTLMEQKAGSVWPADEIRRLKDTVKEAGLELEVIESVNVHEDIKRGLPTRDEYIEHYIRTIEALGEIGIRVICYNFMPVFDWTRTRLDYPLPDGSTTMQYQQSVIDQVEDPQSFADSIQRSAAGFLLTGWEPDRLTRLRDLFAAYEGVSHEALFQNLVYFLKAILPACEKAGIRMAIHPDDPPWDIFGLPRIAYSKETLDRIITEVDHPCNCITFCTGSLGADPANDLPEMARYFGQKDRIAFAHIRNLKYVEPGKEFYEAAHLSIEGSLDLYQIVKALHDAGFDGYIRPDHGRMIWGEQGRAGYGLYDRALGAVYINGLWEAVSKGSEKRNGRRQ